MPYKRRSELPKGVRDSLPPHAQEIYLAAFNSAEEQYGAADESRLARVAWAAVKTKYRRGNDGMWHAMKEATAATPRPARRRPREALKEMLGELLTEPVDDPRESLPLIEQMSMPEPNPVERYMDECYRDAIYSALNLLSRRELEIADTERDALTALVSRLVRKLGTPVEEMEESAPTDAVSLDALQEAAERLLIEQALLEAGQRHRNEDYHVFDQVLELVKKLRGLSPQELKAAQAEQETEEESPAHQVSVGYHQGEPEPVGVQESYQGTLAETMALLREADGDSGLKWDIVVLEAGISKNKRRYSLDVLRQAAPLFEGCRVYAYDRLMKGKEVFDHLSEDELRANPKGYARDLCGFLSQPRIEGHRLVANLTILPSHAWVGQNMQAARRQGLPEPYGFSIDCQGSGQWLEQGGQKILEVSSIDVVNSTDLVTWPAAGGKFLRLVASVAIQEQQEREALALVETLRAQMRVLEVQLRLSDLLDTHEVQGAAKRAVVEFVKELVHD